MNLSRTFSLSNYTKEKLGENNDRIKPYMMDSAYKEEVARKEDVINQVDKDYLLDSILCQNFCQTSN